jgi:hypothetical protein
MFNLVTMTIAVVLASVVIVGCGGNKKPPRKKKVAKKTGKKFASKGKKKKPTGKTPGASSLPDQAGAFDEQHALAPAQGPPKMAGTHDPNYATLANMHNDQVSVLNIFEPYRTTNRGLRCGLDGRQRFTVRLRFEKVSAVRFAVRPEKMIRRDRYLFGAQRVCGPVAVSKKLAVRFKHVQQCQVFGRGAPAFAQGPPRMVSAFDENYATLANMHNDQIFAQGVAAPAQQNRMAGTHDPNYATLANMDNEKVFGRAPQQGRMVATHDPNYQTMAGMDNHVFAK